jgi:hypothetical protein
MVCRILFLADGLLAKTSSYYFQFLQSKILTQLPEIVQMVLSQAGKLHFQFPISISCAYFANGCLCAIKSRGC